MTAITVVDICSTIERLNGCPKVTLDKTRTYRVYDARSPEAILQTADRNGLPVGKITEVRVLDPYFHM
jgi:hypothetical protein